MRRITTDPRPFKVYRRSSGPMVAAVTHAEDAAALVGIGSGIVKHGGRIVFRQGQEIGNELDAVDAADSWDEAACLMYSRIDAYLVPFADKLKVTA